MWATPSQKTIYLTFDAGYENGNTPAILDAEEAQRAGVLFRGGQFYRHRARDLVKRMVDEGHIVGNHTLHHPDMSKIADMDSFRRRSPALRKVHRPDGQPMQRFYVPRRANSSEENLRQAQELGYTTVFWSLAYVDWYTDNQPTDEQAFSAAAAHPTTARSSCCTRRARRMRASLTSCSPNGRARGTRSGALPT